MTSFYRKYDRGGEDYQNTHYPHINSLHPELQERINRYLTLTRSSLRDPPNWVTRQWLLLIKYTLLASHDTGRYDRN